MTAKKDFLLRHRQAKACRTSDPARQLKDQPHRQTHYVEIVSLDLFDEERRWTLYPISARLSSRFAGGNIPIDFFGRHLGKAHPCCFVLNDNLSRSDKRDAR